MHISNCLHPKRIWNKYLNEFMYVPCGKCASCRNARAFNWTKRLEFERRCWKYCLFVTLTYSDEHLPLFKRVGSTLVPKDLKHIDTSKDLFCIDVVKHFGHCRDEKREISWFERNNYEISYLSVYDVQCFIKRLRKNCFNYCKKYYGENNFQASDYQVRYFACGEYGSTTSRAHYHILFFFSSEKQASYLQKIVSKSWAFGIVDSSFVSGSNGSYVASYVNSVNHLPEVYQNFNQIRPFTLCSKQPPIGTLFFDNEEIQKLFYNASPTFFLPNYEKRTFDDVPLWSTFVYRLFPRLSLYSRFSDIDRIRLYGAFEKFSKYSFEVTSSKFVDLMLYHYKNKVFNSWFTHLYYHYIMLLDENVNHDLDSLSRSLVRWYSISSRVFYNCAVWCVDFDYYYSKIKLFYENVEKEKLSRQYAFLSDYEEKYAQKPIGFYREFLLSVIDLSISDLSLTEISVLKSFNIDLNRLYSDDLEVRLQYQYELLPDYQVEFVNHLIDCECISKRLVKTKVKNDYLSANPILRSKVY